MLSIEMLPAHHGDCLWIEYGKPDDIHRIVIDGGPPYAYPTFKARLQSLPPDKRRLELLVVTHVDSDHVGGILALLDDRTVGLDVGDLWFNGWHHLPGERGPLEGAVQGERLSRLIVERKLPWNAAFGGDAVAVPDGAPDTGLLRHELEGGLTLTILSPTVDGLRKLRPKWRREVEKAGLVPGVPLEAAERRKEPPVPPLDIATLAVEPFTSDPSPANRSSIALLLEFEGKRCLLAGDAVSDVLEESLSRLRNDRASGRLHLDAWKISHHGGQHNTSTELARLLAAERYLVSTNGKIYGHPDPETVARLLLHGGSVPRIHFNYDRTPYNRVWTDELLTERYGLEARYPEPGQEGLRVEL